jgi:hypothetical protein
MNEENMANKRMRGNIFGQNAKRKSVPNTVLPSSVLRWPRPTKVSDVKNGTSAKSSDPPTNGDSNYGRGLQRQPLANSLNVLKRSCNTLICQPKPVKVVNLGRNFAEDNYPKSWDINSRLNRQQRFNDNTQTDDFAQELEDRIEADLEVESIFESVSQPRSLSLGKSLPERPGNPIINDKYFLNEDPDSSSSATEKLPSSVEKQIYFPRYRECSIERQRRILQEDYEAENEMHQLLLSPGFQMHTHSASFESLSSSSELSSFESEFSRIFSDEISHEN